MNGPGPLVLDCTIRDGGYLNEWFFEPKLVREVYRAVSKAGIDYCEVGFRGTEADFDPAKYGLWRRTPNELIVETVKGISGAKLAIMADFGKIAADDFEPADESPVTLVRLAAHKNAMRDALALLQAVKAKGYETSLQAMGYSGYSKEEQEELAAMLAGSGIDFIYVADSYGSLFPDQVPELIEALLTLKAEMRIGFHPHNSLQMAFANSIAAIEAGADIVDSSIFGMGRGAGNLPTEIIVTWLQERMPDKFNAIPVLDMVSRHFSPMQAELGWGYQLPFMLSGLFKCHPYYASRLVDMKEFTMEDIWRALTAVQRRDPVGFSQALVDEIVAEGISAPDATAEPRGVAPVPAIAAPDPVPYEGRHAGRAFLVLGNGPTLRTYRPQIESFIAEYDPVVLGANHLEGLFTPDYHAFSNKLRFTSYVDEVAESSVLMVGEHIPEELVREYTQREYETIRYEDSAVADFGIEAGVIACNCRTVSVLLMGVAAVMGADTVFAVGMDGYLNLGAGGEWLFYHEAEEKEDRELIASMHRDNRRYISQIDEFLKARGGEGVHILTPTSYEGFHKGIANYVKAAPR